VLGHLARPRSPMTQNSATSTAMGAHMMDGASCRWWPWLSSSWMYSLSLCMNVLLMYLML